MQVTRVGIPVHNTYTPTVNKPSQIYNAPVTHDIFIKSGNPSFEAYIKTPMEFKQLSQKHVIHCPYCRKPMIYGGLVAEMQRNGLFSGPIIDFVNAITPYKKVLKKGNKQVFSTIARYAQKEPQAELSTVIQSMYSTSIKKLQRQQSKIFGELFEVSKDLPDNLTGSFRAFMRIQHKRLYGIPHQEKFNLKTFTYKISKLAKSISDKKTRESVRILIKPLMEPEFKDLTSAIPKEILAGITDKPLKDKTAEGALRYIIGSIQKYGTQLGRKDIVDLCSNSIKMLNGEAVIVPFSNKEFTHDLARHQLKTLKGSPIYVKMIKIANKLPSSVSDKNSFVVKNRKANSETIGYKLLEPSITTIEHIKPSSEKGVDTLENMALACKADNNERQSLRQYLYLRKWPKRNPQIYFNDIIYWTNKEAIFHPDTVEQMANSFWEQGKIKIDTSKLRGLSEK